VPPEKKSGLSRGGALGREMRIENPLFIVFRDPGGKVITHIHPPDDYDHTHYGILICDLVRHVARAMKVSEDDIWTWVDKERDRLTSDIINPS